MRLLIVASTAPPPYGGMQSWLLDLIEGFAPRHDVAVLCNESADPGLLRERGASRLFVVERLACERPEEREALVRATLGAAREHRAELAHLTQAGLVSLAAPLAEAGVRSVVSTHGKDLTQNWMWGIEGPPEPRHRALREHFPDVHLVTAVSGFTRRMAIETGAPEPVRVIPPAVDTERFSPGDRRDARRRLGLPLDRPLILSVGRLVLRKGFLDTVAAMQGLAGRGALLAIVGEGPDEGEIVRFIDALGVGDRVRLFGSVDPERLLHCYRAADLFALPAYERDEVQGRDCEGFGIVFLEAAACGLPCVAASAGGVPDAVVDGVTGVLVPPNDVPALGGALEAMIGDRERARALGAAGRKRAVEEFTLDRMIERFEEAFTEAGEMPILRRRRPGSPDSTEADRGSVAP